MISPKDQRPRWFAGTQMGHRHQRVIEASGFLGGIVSPEPARTPMRQ